MSTFFALDTRHGVYYFMEKLRSELKSPKRNIVERDTIGFTLLHCYNQIMSSPSFVGNSFALTYIEQCLASGDRSEEEQAALAKKIGQSVIDCIEHHRLQPMKENPSVFDTTWNDEYHNSVQIGRVLTAAYYKIRVGLSSNESFLKVSHFIKDYEQILGEAVINAVMEFRFGVSCVDDL